jgi:hypothetical protein
MIDQKEFCLLGYDAMEEHIGSIFRFEEQVRQENSAKKVASRGDMFLLKRPLTFNGPYSVISQKAELFITIAMTTSNPT